ncbi:MULTISPECIES: YveK family protein [unclassified Modestobacter]
MELRDYWAALRRYWTTWLAIAFTGLLLALAVVLVTPPTYQATAQVFVASVDGGTNGSQFVSQRVKSYPDVAVSSEVLDPVIDELDLTESSTELRSSIIARNPVDTSQLEVVVTSRSPERAADIANAVAVHFGEVVERLETPGSGSSPVDLTVTNPATVPTTPVSPVPHLLLALGLVVGLASGIALAVVRSRMDTAVYDADDVRAAWGVDDELVVHATATGRAARSALTGRPSAALARRLEQLAEDQPIRVAVLSASPDPAQEPADLIEDVAAQLRSRQVVTAVGESSSVQGDSPVDRAPGHPGSPDEADVRLDVCSPLASLRAWRQLAARYDHIVLAVAPGAVDRTEIAEMRTILAAAGLRPLAVVLSGSRRRGRRRHRATPTSAAVTGPSGPRERADTSATAMSAPNLARSR